MDRSEASPPIRELSTIPNLPGFNHGYTRILLHSKEIKYLTFPSDRFTNCSPFDLSRLSSLDLPLDKDWNVGTVSTHQSHDSEKVVIKSTEKRDLDRVTQLWHPRSVDYLDLGPEARKGVDWEFDISTCQLDIDLGPDADSVTVEMEWFPDWVYGPKVETEVHAAIQNKDVGPRFLAHVTENHDRVIGFIRDKVQGRAASIDDLDACRAVLERLHACRYLLDGGLNRFNFCIQDENGDEARKSRKKKRAVIVKFAGCRKSSNAHDFAKEMDSLEVKLASKSHWGNPDAHAGISAELRAQIDRINLRDDGVHPAIWDMAIDEGKVDIGAAEHQWMLYDLRRELGCANNVMPAVDQPRG